MFQYVRYSILILVTLIVIAAIYLISNNSNNASPTLTSQNSNDTVQSQTSENDLPVFIESQRNRNYPSSDILIEQTLSPGTNYNRYIAYYTSDGLKIYGLMTVPNTSKPEKGFPAIVFLHGYLPPTEYVTTERYIAYQDGFARNGFITFKTDLRGHGRSEGKAVDSHFSDAYIADTLNLVSSLKNDPDVDSNRIGAWGHSNGGGITLRSMVVSKDIKAGVMWAGVVGSYQDLLETYRQRIPWIRSRPVPDLVEKFGTPSANPNFWDKVDSYNYLNDISGPIQLHHGTSDDSVPVEFSIHLRDELQKLGKSVEYYEYPGADHNLSAPAFSSAMQRSVEFFKKYL